MTDGVSKLEARAGSLARRLRQDLRPATDLWPRIAARIESKAPPRRGQLAPAVEPERDLWPGIRARIDTGHTLDGTSRRRKVWGTGFATAAGVAAVAALTLMLTTRPGDIAVPRDAAAPADSSAAAELPGWMRDTLARVGRAGGGTPAVELGDVARSIERDFLMVRSQRLRIEQALAVAGSDMNLRTQWRQVYLAELRLIEETERLASIYGTRTQI